MKNYSTEFKETYKGELIAVTKAMIDYLTVTEPAILRGGDKTAILSVLKQWINPIQGFGSDDITDYR